MLTSEERRERNRATQARYRERHRERVNLRQQRYREGRVAECRIRSARCKIEQKYGITYLEYLERFRLNGGRCGICTRSIELGQGPGRSACLDHDHVTGKLRDFLCMTCNAGIGGLRDDVDLLLKAIKYLEMHQ